MTTNIFGPGLVNARHNSRSTFFMLPSKRWCSNDDRSTGILHFYPVPIPPALLISGRMSPQSCYPLHLPRSCPSIMHTRVFKLADSVIPKDGGVFKSGSLHMTSVCYHSVSAPAPLRIGTENAHSLHNCLHDQSYQTACIYIPFWSRPPTPDNHC